MPETKSDPAVSASVRALADVLVTYFHEHDTTQEKAAKLWGVSQPLLSNIINRRVHRLRRETLEKLFAVLRDEIRARQVTQLEHVETFLLTQEFDEAASVVAEVLPSDEPDLIQVLMPEQQAKAHYLRGRILEDKGRHSHALPDYHQSRALYEQIGSQREQLLVSLREVACLLHLGEQERVMAASALREIGEQLRYSHDAELLGTRALLEGALSWYVNQYEQSFASYEIAYTRFREIGEQRELAKACTGMALASRKLGSWDRADRYFAEALEVEEKIADSRGLALTLLDRSTLYTLRGKWFEALEGINLGLGICRGSPNPNEYTYCNLMLLHPRVHTRLGRFDLSRKLLNDAGRIVDMFRRQSRDREAEGERGRYLRLEGLASEAQGELLLAEATEGERPNEDLARLAMKPFQGVLTLDPDLKADHTIQSVIGLTECNLVLGQIDDATKYLRIAEDAEGNADRVEKAWIWRLKAELKARSGDLPGARALYDQSIDELRRLDARYDLAKSLEACGRTALRERAGSDWQPAKVLKEAADLYRSLYLSERAQRVDALNPKAS